MIIGAGISVQAGIPDFWSSEGVFRSVKKNRSTLTSGKELFDVSVFSVSHGQYHFGGLQNVDLGEDCRRGPSRAHVLSSSRCCNECFSGAIHDTMAGRRRFEAPFERLFFAPHLKALIFLVHCRE